MNLAKSVERFTLETVTDPYGVGAPIAGHLSVFSDEKSSGEATRRRVFETSTAYTMYSSNCILHLGQVYIVGQPNYDYHKGAAIRAKYPVIPVDETCYIQNIGDIVSGTSPTKTVYAFLFRDRSPVADSETSFSVNELTAFLPDLESVSKGQVIVSNNVYYRIKSDPWIDGAGFKNVVVIQLDDPLQSVTVTQKSSYDPITDSMTNGSTFTGTAVFIEDAYYCYTNESERYTQLKPGDKNITFGLTTVPKAGDSVGDYSILTVDVVSEAIYSCHCRKI